MKSKMSDKPQHSREFKRIVCLTEESVEFLHALGREELIVGVSAFVERPVAAKAHKVVSTFTHSNYNKIKEVSPDLIIGFSDIQKDIARDLIESGFNVYISNQRSIDEILRYLYTLGLMVDEKEKTQALIVSYENKIQEAVKIASSFKTRPKVYIEEWDSPQICGIHWFTELVEICGGDVIFKERSIGKNKASERFVTNLEIEEANPEVAFLCWCGKKVDFDSFNNRPGFREIMAVKNNQVYELDPAVFLQPGPALFVDGIDQLLSIFKQLDTKN